jgi:HD-like signal output (HDOD) protein
VSPATATRVLPTCDRSAVHVRLLRLFASPAYRPPLLPGVALEIIALSQRPEVSFGEVSGVLEHDPVLAAKVLSIAQSSLYRARSPVLSLQQATVRLGLGTLRSIVVEASLSMKVFDAPGYEAAMTRLSWHSTVTAYLMRAFCRKGAIEGEYAFLCGLLHDVGMAASLLALSDDARGRAIPFEALGPVLDEVHQEASGLVTRLWGLPSEIQHVVATHHQLHVGGTPHPVNATLIVAERLARELGAGMQPPPGEDEGAPALDASAPGLFEEAAAALGLTAAALASMRIEATELVAKLGPHPALRAPANEARR